MTTHTTESAAEPRWRAFAQFIAQGLSQTEAYRQAGFKAKSAASASTLASRLLRKVEVQALVRQATELASQGRITTARRRREILSEIAEGTARVQSEGPTGPTVRDPTPAERVAAIKHLDELDGLMVQRHEVAGLNGQPISAMLATIPDDVLRARIAELAARKGLAGK
jgi:phage terminase small subunit